MTLFRRLKDLLPNQRGNAMLLGVAAMPLLIGSAAVAVDSVNMSLTKRQLQRAADSGALAGAYAVVQSKSAQASVLSDLQQNNDVTLNGAAVVENAPSTGTFAGNARAVRVVLNSDVPMSFFSVFGQTKSVVTAEATAAVVVSGNFCMLSLEEGSATGVTFWGNTSVDIGCGVATNAKSANSIVAGASSTVKATPITAQGGVPQSSHYVSPTTLLPYSPKQKDPFAKLPVPQVPSSCESKLSIGSNDTYTIPARTDGIYCYKGMDIKGTLTLQPGIYYIDGSTFNVGAQGQVNGTGVTFILTSSTAATNGNSVASVDLQGGSGLNLTAPKSGTYEGVLFYQDPRATLGNTIEITGNSTSILEGAFYFPRSDLTYSGNTGMQTKCIQLVARRLRFTGNSKVQNTCPTDGGAHSFAMMVVRLVG